MLCFETATYTSETILSKTGENRMKKKFYTEAAYLFGIVILAIGTAFMERADFGMSMIVAPAYLLHLKISETFSIFTFGMAEYTIQAALIVLLAVILRKMKLCYLFSFMTAVIYGFILDGAMAMVAFMPYNSLWIRIACYIVGMILCAIGVSFLFHTYISPEAYELFVKEMAMKFQKPVSRIKTIYDCTSCVLSIGLSFLFFGFGHFEGVKLGTVICALLNGWLIGKVTLFLENRYEFCDGVSLRGYFET